MIGALGPMMLTLAGKRAGGAHPYNVPPDHTARARDLLGPSALLVPEQAVAATTDRTTAYRMARSFFAHYFTRPNYTNNLRRLGFGEDDFANGGSDRVIDALLAWGDEQAIARRVQQHLDAGADSVCIQVIGDGPLGGMSDFHRQAWRDLAPALTSLAPAR